MKCGKCESELILTSGNQNTPARYICPECGMVYLQNGEPLLAEVPCPYCGSHYVRKGGLSRRGEKRYFCNICKKSYTASTVIDGVIEEPKTLNCPKCGSDNYVKCGSEHGKQRYKCKKCGRRFVTNPNRKVCQFHEKQCPICGHKYAVKCGTENGKQYYRCKSCRHKYSEEYVYRQLTEDQVKNIYRLFEEGLTNNKIAKELNISVKTVYNKLYPYKMAHSIKDILSGKTYNEVISKYNVDKELLDNWLIPYYAKEKLSMEQKNLIFKFGVMFDIPVEYVAPYVPCSIRICQEFMNTHPKRSIVKQEATQQQLAMDKVELDKFI